jgi:hypothetical protein
MKVHFRLIVPTVPSTIGCIILGLHVRPSICASASDLEPVDRHSYICLES